MNSFLPQSAGTRSQNSGGNFTSVTKILNKTEERSYTVSSLTAGTHYFISCIFSFVKKQHFCVLLVVLAYETW